MSLAQRLLDGLDAEIEDWSKTVHPADLIEAESETEARSSRDFGRGMSHAANTLRDHEQEHDVRFLAVPAHLVEVVKEVVSRG